MQTITTDQSSTESIIRSYIDKDKFHQALMLDGEWGSGKTWLLNRLIEDIRSSNKEKLCLYISLNGMRSTDEIDRKLYTEYSVGQITGLASNALDNAGIRISPNNKKILNKGVRFAGKTVGFAGHLFSVGLSHGISNVLSVRIDGISDQIKQFKPKRKIEDVILVFDDVERCLVNTVELFGYLNNLVEHEGVRMILVCNESELSSECFYENLPLKYLVAADHRVHILPEKDGNSSNNQVSGSSDAMGLSVEDLRNRAEKLFPKQETYISIKEKLVGIHVRYQSDMSTVYDSVVEEYAVEAKKFLLSKRFEIKKAILNIFDVQRSSNIRTLIYVIIFFEDLYAVVDSKDFINPKSVLCDEHKSFFCYLLLLSLCNRAIDIREKGIPTACSAISLLSETVPPGRYGGLFDERRYEYRVMWFKAVDIFIQTGQVDIPLIKQTYIKWRNDEEKRVEDNKISDERRKLSMVRLNEWWKLEDEEINRALEDLKKEITDNKYSPYEYKPIVCCLLQIANPMFGFTEMSEAENLCEKFEDRCSMVDVKAYVKLLTDAFKQTDKAFDINDLELITYDEKFRRQYEEAIYILRVAEECKAEENADDNIGRQLVEHSWNGEFPIFCVKRKQDFLLAGKFLGFYDYDDLRKRIREADTKDVYNFGDGLSRIYKTVGSDYLRGDDDIVNRLTKELSESKNILEYADEKRTKTMALVQLYKTLKKN